MVNKYYSLVEDGKSADLFIFGDITSFEMTNSDVSSYSIQQELAELDVDEINVHINSYGGEVAEALAIYNMLVRHKASVTTYVDGFACSAATIIFMAGDKRIMSEVGNFLIHPAWEMTMGNADDLRKEADNLDAITEQSVTVYVEKTGKSRDEIIDLMAEERFLTPEEVLEWGFATEIEDASASERVAASIDYKIHKILLQQEEDDMPNEPFDLDELAEKIVTLLIEKIEAGNPSDADPEEPEDPEKEPETEEPDEEPDLDPEEEPEEKPETEDNQKASIEGCFFDAFKK